MNLIWTLNLLNLLFISIYLVYVLIFGPAEPISLNVSDYGDAPEMIESRGFKCETHHMVTSDGYILQHFRIINPYNLKPNKTLILQSGLFATSDDFIVNSAGGHLDNSMLQLHSLDYLNFSENYNNLGFLLANLGYDVWLTNPRGNYYTRNHTTLDPNSSEFWSTGMDDIIAIDLPETIEYVLKQTGKGDDFPMFYHWKCSLVVIISNRYTVGYIGMSRGAAVMFGLQSEKPEYSEKIKPFVAIAPGVFVGKNDETLIRRFFGSEFVSNYLLEHPQICFSRDFVGGLSKFCSIPGINFICPMLKQRIYDSLSPHVNKSRLGVLFHHYPAGSPCWDLVQYGQIIKTKQFQKIDLGQQRNLVKYGQPEPPIYKLDKINSQDIVIISSLGDKTVRPECISKLVDHLTVKPKELIVVDKTDFTHADLLMAKSSGELVNKNIIRILSEY